jgi:mRNA interferase MazF
VQTDALLAEHASVIVCQMTSDGDDAPDFRVVIEPTAQNGLHTRSHVMADKPVGVRESERKSAI